MRRFISFYHDELIRFYLDFYRLSRRQNDHKRSKAIIIDHCQFFALNQFAFNLIKLFLLFLFFVNE